VRNRGISARRRVGTGSLAVAAALAAVPVGSAAGARSAVTDVAGVAAPATAPPITTATFAPGTWKGRAIGTGGISASGAEGFLPEPVVLDFEFSVRADGTVESGVWQWSGEVVSATADASGIFQMTGSGPLGGTNALVEITGTINMSGSVTVNGNVLEVDQDMPAEASFFASWTACTVATGDLAIGGRAVQQSAGVATTVKAPFTARMVAGPDADSTIEQVFFELVTDAEAIIAAGAPVAGDVVDLVLRIERWHHELFRAARCGSATPNLMPGTQPHTYLVELIGSILVAALSNPAAYSTNDILDLGLAALRIGVIGTAAVDPAFADQVEASLRAALQSKLDTAEDEIDCQIVGIAANALGFTDIAAGAVACAG
jgi:hypothetical protein